MHKKFSDKYRLLLQKIEVSRDQLDRAVADGDCSAASRELDQILNLAGQVDLLMSAGASIPVTNSNDARARNEQPKSSRTAAHVGG